MGSFASEHIRQIIEGDRKAFKAVFDSYYPKLVGVAMKYHADSMVAEDVVAEVFKNIWEKRSSISEQGSFDSFLYSSVRNRMLNYLRHASIQRHYKEQVLSEKDDQELNEYILEEEVHYKLYKALKELPEQRRRVFELSVLYGWREKEIAEDLGISVNTIKTHKKRALQDLRLKLKNLVILLFSF